MSIIIEQFINIYAPGLQNPSIDTSAQILVCFLPVLIDKLIFFLPSTMGREVLIYLIPQQEQEGGSKPLSLVM